MKKKDLKEEALKKETGMRFKQFREFINKSQTKLAEELQVPQDSISKIERGKIFPGLILYRYLNVQYHLNINWLIHGSGEMTLSLLKKKYLDLPEHLSQIDENDPRYANYVELFKLLRVRFIEDIIFAKLTEMKVIAKKQIDSFFEET